ncbi:hypothetical protein KI387_033924, partial [Taxus chinensis]
WGENKRAAQKTRWKGLAFPHMTDWDGVFVAGMFSMAAHCSGFWGKGGGIHEYVVGIKELNNVKINASNLCKLAGANFCQFVKAGNGYLNDGQIFKGFPVVGYNHHMQSSSGCQIDPRSEEPETCPWEGKELKSNDTICNWDTEVKGNIYHHMSITIPLSRIIEAIRDLKHIRYLDPTALCTLDSYLVV